jgi:hypothetical protein
MKKSTPDSSKSHWLDKGIIPLFPQIKLETFINCLDPDPGSGQQVSTSWASGS